MENKENKTPESVEWLISKLHSYHLGQSKVSQNKLSSRSSIRQVLALERGPVDPQSNEVPHVTAGVPRECRQVLIQEVVITKPKSTLPSWPISRKKKPPQIPSENPTLFSLFFQIFHFYHFQLWVYQPIHPNKPSTPFGGASITPSILSSLFQTSFLGTTSNITPNIRASAGLPGLHFITLYVQAI